MTERSRAALRQFRKLNRKPKYRVQGQSPSPESLPKKQQWNGLNNTTTNMNTETMEKQSMDDKPMIQCPHCTKIIEAERLVSQRKYRNAFGLDVFECPDCHKNYKIEPREYLETREHINEGNLPNTHIIKAAMIDEILPSEKMAIDYDRRTKAPWRGPAKIIAVIAFLIIVFLILN